MSTHLHGPPHTVPDPAGAIRRTPPTAGAAELVERWPMLDFRPMRLNGFRGDPGPASTYTVLDAQGLRVVGEIHGRDDGRFTACAAGGAPEGVFDTVAAALEALSRATQAGAI